MMVAVSLGRGELQEEEEAEGQQELEEVEKIVLAMG